MSSIIEGYNYDIFISYRQKDNKHDGWVTEFVDNLKGELESTFKEEVSVYFDINPHDGLLETHDVGESLKEKLKCVVFIPIISRTYCDPKSFAWEHEFKSFVEMASQDQFGLKVKLPNGNVANRVLPIRIHDLDINDIKECESVLSGVLRGVEFIYSEPGVNRPLKSDDDERINLNKTKYRNQINKIANTLKDLIGGLSHSVPSRELIPSEGSYETQKLVKEENKFNLRKRKIGIAVLAIITLFIGSLLIFKFPFNRNGIDNVKEKTIAVLPFQYRGSDVSQLWISEEFAEEIRSNLQIVKSFIVRPKSSSDLFRDIKGSSKEIGRKLNANYLVEGSVTVDGNNLKMKVNLIDSRVDKSVWINEYPGELKEILPLVSKVAQQIVSELKTELSPYEKGRIEKYQAKNPEAYNLYLQGRNLWKKRTSASLRKSIEFYNKALSIDPAYALAYTGLADSYYNLVSTLYLPGSEGYPKAREYALRAVAIDNEIAETHITLATLYMWSDWKWEDARRELSLAINLNPKYSPGYFNYAALLQVLGEDEKARDQMNTALDLDPDIAVMRALSAHFYYLDGNYEEALAEAEKASELDTGFYGSYTVKFLTYLEQKEDLKALESFQHMIRLDSLSKKNLKSVNEIYITSGISGIINWAIDNQPKPFHNHFYKAILYSKLEKREEALSSLEKGVEEKTYDMPRINNCKQLDYLRNETRFQALIKKMGLSEYQKIN